MKRPEIHVVHPQRYVRSQLFGLVDANHRALAMNALLTEAVIGRKLDFNGDDLSDGGCEQSAIIGRPPPQQQAATADVLRVDRTLQPQNRRGDVATELDIDTRTLTPVRGLHLWAGYDNRDCSLEHSPVQYRKWVTLWRWRRLSHLSRTSFDVDLPHYEQHKNIVIYLEIAVPQASPRRDVGHASKAVKSASLGRFRINSTVLEQFKINQSVINRIFS